MKMKAIMYAMAKRLVRSCNHHYVTHRNLCKFVYHHYVSRIIETSHLILNEFKCPCCESNTCEFSLRTMLNRSLDGIIYLMYKDGDDSLYIMFDEYDISYYHYHILKGVLPLVNTPLLIYNCKNIYSDDLCMNGCIFTSFRKLTTYKRFFKVIKKDITVSLKLDKVSLLYVIALGPVMHSILIQKNMLHPNTFLLYNGKKDFLNSIQSWVNVDVLYCIDLKYLIPVTSMTLDKYSALLEQFFPKTSILYKLSYNIISQYVTLKDNTRIDNVILAYDCLIFSYIINAFLFEPICWALDHIPSCRFYRCHTKLLIASNDDNKNKIEQLIDSNLHNIEGLIHILKEDDGFYNLWGNTITIKNGMIINQIKI